MSGPHLRTYAYRAQNHPNAAARLLLETVVRKKSNLSVSVDVTSADDFLAIIDAVGPYVCLIKTHIDIIEDFTPTLIQKLQALSQEHDFLIFEDRKFADIGNTVALQYSSGVYKIASWAHITNAHTVPGPSIVTGLASVGLPLGRGLLLLAEMSSKGSLATGEYTEEAARMARANPNFVMGFIAQRRMETVGLTTGATAGEDDFLVLAPGVGLESKGDAMGQQYRTPREVILKSGCDIIIVGRGVYGNPKNLNIQEVRNQAERYRTAGWEAYEERVLSQ